MPVARRRPLASDGARFGRMLRQVTLLPKGSTRRSRRTKTPSWRWPTTRLSRGRLPRTFSESPPLNSRIRSC
eukprot:1786969-Pyramimonas_sp.AAC.1